MRFEILPSVRKLRKNIENGNLSEKRLDKNVLGQISSFLRFSIAGLSLMDLRGPSVLIFDYIQVFTSTK